MTTLNYILAAFTLLFSLNSLANNPVEVESVVKQFYDWRIKTAFTGVPDAVTLKMADQFLSAELTCLLGVARNYRDLYAKHFPTDKPPFVEGDMFTSLFEGANRYRVESVRVNKVQARAQVQLHFYFDQNKNKDTKGWRDTVLLEQKNQHWRITDVHYNAHFNFGNSGSLRKNLSDELSENNDELHWQGKKQLESCRLGVKSLN